MSEFLDKMWIFAPVWFHRFYRNGLDREISNVSIDIGNLQYVQYFHQLQTSLVDNAMKFFQDILGHDQKRVKMYVHQPKIRKKSIRYSTWKNISYKFNFFDDQFPTWFYHWYFLLGQNGDIFEFSLDIFNRKIRHCFWSTSPYSQSFFDTWSCSRSRISDFGGLISHFFTYFPPLNFLFYAWQSRPDICSSS